MKQIPVRYRRWAVFFFLVVALSVLLLLFGQSSSLTSFIYLFF